MHQSRRKFINKSSKTLLSLSLLPSLQGWSKAINKNIKLGLQLYSIRNTMFNETLSSLKKVREIGYENVEHAGYINGKMYNMSVKEFKNVLDDLGLKMMSGHTSLTKEHINSKDKSFTKVWLQTIEDAAYLGQEFVISPWIDDYYRKDYNKFLELMEMFNKCGELCSQYNMKFGYHNHHFEFTEKFNDKLIYDIIFDKTDPKFVIQQFDIGNPYGVIGKPNSVIEKHPSRIISMHVKDEIKNLSNLPNEEPYISTILGQGLVDPKSVCLDGLKIGGTIHFIVEQESYQGKDPFDCIKADWLQLSNYGLTN